MVDGFHVPTIPFGEVVSKVGAFVPLQSVNAVAKLGVIESVTVIVMVTVEAH